MHVYIFDEFLNTKRYEKTVAAIETRITDLGLQGKNRHVGTLKSLASVVADELRNTPTTLVAVGNDATFSQIINAVKDRNITVGYIPVGTKHVELARFLGIENEEHACTTLSARLIEAVRPGLCNRAGIFIRQARIPTAETLLEINGLYTLHPDAGGTVSIHAAGARTPGTLDVRIDIEQRSLFRGSTESRSCIASKTVILNNNQDLPLVLDEAIQEKTPVEITVAPFTMKLIVGKNRQLTTAQS